MISRLPHIAWLTAVWCALWGEVTVANVAGGLAVGSGVIAAFPRAGPRPGGLVVRPLAALRFIAYFAYKLVEANAVVAWEVVTPNNDSVREGVVTVEVTGASDALVTILANAISLTPGTLTLEVRRDPSVLLVHVLHLRSIERTRSDVRRLEVLALRAFGNELALSTDRAQHTGEMT